MLDDEAKAAGRTVFSGYLNDAPTVNDPKDFFECGRLREYFGFDADYPIDEDITAELERLQCIPDFEDFEDLVRDGGSDSTLVETKCSRFLEEPGTCELCGYSALGMVAIKTTSHIKENFSKLRTRIKKCEGGKG